MKKKIIFIGGIVFIFAIFLFGIISFINIDNKKLDNEVVVTIKQSSGAKAIASTLNQVNKLSK